MPQAPQQRRDFDQLIPSMEGRAIVRPFKSPHLHVSAQIGTSLRRQGCVLSLSLKLRLTPEPA